MGKVLRRKLVVVMATWGQKGEGKCAGNVSSCLHCPFQLSPSAASLAGLNVVQLMSTSAAGNRAMIHLVSY